MREYACIFAHSFEQVHAHSPVHLSMCYTFMSNKCIHVCVAQVCTCNGVCNQNTYMFLCMYAYDTYMCRFILHARMCASICIQQKRLSRCQIGHTRVEHIWMRTNAHSHPCTVSLSMSLLLSCASARTLSHYLAQSHTPSLSSSVSRTFTTRATKSKRRIDLVLDLR